MSLQHVAAFLSIYVGEVHAHGTIYEPPPRQSHGANVLRPACTGGACLWFNQGCTIGCPFCTGGGSVYPDEPDCKDPAKPTLGHLTDRKYRTYGLNSPLDWTTHKPWRYPGSAPVLEPCGLAGGWFTEGTPGNGGYAAIGFQQGAHGSNTTILPPLLEKTVWIAGTTAEVAWGITANHGGGYQYRLCPANSADKSETCFQKMPLKFLGDSSWLQHGNGMDVTKRDQIPAVQVPGDKVMPLGSTWRRNPIPACDTPITGGAIHSKCLGPMFTPPISGGEGESYGFGVGTCESEGLPTGSCDEAEFKQHFFDFGIVDQVEVPDVPEGDYIISFRWDCEQTPQIWTQCSDVTIKKSGAPTKPFVPTNGCTACCIEGAMCGNCSACTDTKSGDCAYCWEPLKGYAPGIPPITCLGFAAEDGSETPWMPGDNKVLPMSFGCSKCYSDKDKYCKSYERESVRSGSVSV